MRKFSVYSIKTQIVAAFFLLVLPLVSLIYFTSLSNKLFNGVLAELTETEAVAYLLNEVEKDIVDLQRNVLIFKETASQEAADKVLHYYVQIVERLARLKSFSSVMPYYKSIDVMSNHLDDYKNNFDIVVGLRVQRSQLIENHLASKPLIQLERFQQSAVMATENYFLLGHNASLSYLATLDHTYITEYESYLERSRISLKTVQADPATLNAVEAGLINYQKNFSRIVSLTRHYSYLVNVVMTGSANEFLYHGKTIADQFYQRASKTHASASERMSKHNVRSNLLSLAGILLAITVAVMFYLRITRPIEAITDVFIQLAEGKDIGAIDEDKRKDEIGLLASAANVFKSKNKQTLQLLSESKRMVVEQKSLNEALDIEKRRAERALSIKTEFLANMSHELRTPLNSIIGFTVRLSKQMDPNNDRQLKALSAVERNGRHLLAMINDILDLSKIEANKLDLKITTLNLSDLCMDCTAQINPAAEEKGLEMIFNSTDIPDVETDAVRVRQILFNLLSNAVKYTNSGTVKVDVEMGFGNTHVAIKITDTGVGIKPEDQKKLFKRFEQFDDNTRFDVGQGTGLGLAIVANLSHLLGATVSVSSDYKKGSCFCLRVPLKFKTKNTP